MIINHILMVSLGSKVGTLHPLPPYWDLLTTWDVGRGTSDFGPYVKPALIRRHWGK